MFEEFRKVFGTPICAGMGGIQIPILIEDPLNYLAWFALSFAWGMAIVMHGDPE